MADLNEEARERLYKSVGGRRAPVGAVARPTLLGRLRTYVLAGILVTAPAGVTVWLALWFLRFVDDRIMPLVPERWNPETYLPFSVPGLGLLLLLLVLLLIGMATAGMVGRAMRRQGARLIAHVPVLRSIYSTTEQLFETVLTQSKAFREVVLVEYPRHGTWTVGFVTGQTEGEVQGLIGPTVINVLVPTSPNPTTGYLLFLPESDVHRLPITVEQGLKLIISSGIVQPDEPPPADLGEAERLAAAEALVARRLASMEAEPEPMPPTPGQRLLARLKTYLGAGILVTAPTFITCWLAWQILRFFGEAVTPLLPVEWTAGGYMPVIVPAIGIPAMLILLVLIGMFATGYAGRAVVALGERLVRRVPIIRGLYKAMKQVLETVLAQQSNAFREVVLIEYPRPNSYSLGFVAGGGSAVIEGGAKRELVSVFVATTPNPTSGFLLFVPQDEAVVLKMTVEEALKMVVSGGLITPPGSSEATLSATA